MHRFFRRLFKAALFLGLLGASAWLFHVPLLRSAARAWVVDDPVPKADAIVVLGGGRDWRPFAAAEMYKAGIAATVLVANVEVLRSEQALSQPSETQVNLAVLSNQGVPNEHVETFGTSVTSTRDEAVGLREWAQAHHVTSVVIPTDTFHTRRVRWIFERELSGTSVAVHVKLIENTRYDLDRWWESEDGFLSFQNELLKSLYYLVKY